MTPNRHLFCSIVAFFALLPIAAAAQTIVDAGEDVVLECESEDGTEYTLNGTAPTGEGFVNEWTTAPEVELDDADTLTPTGEFPLGITTVTLSSTQDGGAPASDSATVTVQDTQPPAVRVTADPFYLWPPNHKMHEIEMRVRVRDRCSGDDFFDVILIGVRSNEPDNSTGDGNTTDDIQSADIGSDDRTIMLRAERKGNGNGRVYTLTYRVTDGEGNQTEAEAKVYVPHDYSDLKELIGNDDRPDEMDAICPRPADAVDQVVEIFPGLGSANSEKACNTICRAWTKSCDRIARGTAKCVQGEQKALSLIGFAECKDSDYRDEVRECREDVKEELAEQKRELREEAGEARETCAHTGRRCANACDDMFDDVTTPVED